MGFNSGFKGLKLLATSSVLFLNHLFSNNDELKFYIHGSVHRRLLSRNTNKMQLCNRIYYSKVYWRLSIFRAAQRSSSEALNCICSLWFTYPCGDRPLPLSLGNGRSPHRYINQRLQIQFGAPDVPLETCWAFNKLWNNKFYYKAASCWYFYWRTKNPFTRILQICKPRGGNHYRNF